MFAVSTSPGAAPVSSSAPRSSGPLKLQPLVLGLVHIAALSLGLVYALRIEPGLPADEPAHWNNVLYYAAHQSLPVLGQPSVGYEGQMGPVYYALSAVVCSLVSAKASVNTAFSFYFLRTFWLLLIPLAVTLTNRLAQQLSPSNMSIQLGIVGFVSLNPSLLKIAGSIQNDYLSLVLCLFSTLLCLTWSNAKSRVGLRGAAIGAVTSLGILTKANLVFLPPSIILYWCLFGKQRVRFGVGLATTVILLTGWWFFRNVMLYGDPTANAALTKFDYHNNPPPVPWTLHDIGMWFYGIPAYTWLGSEYYRSLAHATLFQRCMTGAFLVTTIGGYALNAKQKLSYWLELVDNKTSVLALTEFALCFAIFTYSCFKFCWYGSRITFPVVFTTAAIISVGGYALFSRFGAKAKFIFPLALIAVLLLFNLQTLDAATQVRLPSYLRIPFTS